MHREDVKQIMVACMPFHFAVISNLGTTMLKGLEFKMLNMYLPFEPAILPVGVYPRGIKT